MRSRVRASSPVEASPISNPSADNVARKLRRIERSSSTRSTTPWLSVIFSSRVAGHCQEKAIGIVCRLHPGAPTVCLGRLLYDGETKSCAGGPSRGISATLKSVEDPFPVRWRNRRAGVCDGDDGLAFVIGCGNADIAANI